MTRSCFSGYALSQSVHCAVVSKANKLLGLFRRTLTNMNNEFSRAIQVSRTPMLFGQSHLRRTSTSWSVQRLAIRLSSSLRDIDYTATLELLKLPSMAYRKTRTDVTEVYKYCRGSYTTGSQLLAMSNDERTRGHSFKLHLQSCTTRVRRDSSAVEQFTEDVVFAAVSVNCFKNDLTITRRSLCTTWTSAS